MSGLDLQGFLVTATQNTFALLLNNIPILYPGATASVQMQSGKNLMLWQSAQPTRGFVMRKPPVTPVIHLVGDLAINSEADGLGRTIFQLQTVPAIVAGSGPASLASAWRGIGKFSSPVATASTAVTLSGGTSDDIDSAIVRAGDGGQVILTGSFTVTRPIRLEGVLPAGQTLTFVMSSPTFTGFSSLSLSTTTIGPTVLVAAKSWLNNGQYLGSPFGSGFWTDILQNGSFTL